ncbi:Ion channel [Popillia japonica]|uniref:Ion channel n=1 Tax=Popillia japonica TaxID=7064 RepID=A0AAW1L6R3_POPJA
MERQRSIRRRRRNEKNFAKKCKEYFRSFIAFMFSNVGIIGLVVGYAIAGAFIFIYIEEGYAKPSNLTIGYNMTLYRNRTAIHLWDLTISMNVFNKTNWTQTITNELLIYQLNVTKAVKEKGYDGHEDNKKTWSISVAFLYSLTVITTIGKCRFVAFLYSLTVITTIGYGNIVPKTDWGKVTTIIYAIIGMPLFLLYLSNIGDIMARSFKWLYATCCLCKGCPRVSQRREERKQRKLQQRMEMGDIPYGSEASEDSWQVCLFFL